MSEELDLSDIRDGIHRLRRDGYQPDRVHLSTEAHNDLVDDDSLILAEDTDRDTEEVLGNLLGVVATIDPDLDGHTAVVVNSSKGHLPQARETVRP